MKKQNILLLCVFLFLSGCSVPITPPPASSPIVPSHHWTFEEVSQPYLDARGAPEETYKFTSGDYCSIDWWWWTQGFQVSFLDSPYDEVNGWTVDSTFEFDPIP